MTRLRTSLIIALTGEPPGDRSREFTTSFLCTRPSSALAHSSRISASTASPRIRAMRPLPLHSFELQQIAFEPQLSRGAARDSSPAFNPRWPLTACRIKIAADQPSRA